MLPTSLLCGVGRVLSLAALSQLAPLHIPLSSPLVSNRRGSYVFGTALLIAFWMAAATSLVDVSRAVFVSGMVGTSLARTDSY